MLQLSRQLLFCEHPFSADLLPCAFVLVGFMHKKAPQNTHTHSLAD